MRSLEQFIQTVKGPKQFLITIFFTDSRRFLISTLDFRIDLGQEALPKRLNVGPWINIENRKFGKKKC